ncbi:MAG: cytochrome c oxidase assembly protein [Candidatus Rokubacteria bacterium]|nr:cytochrome c oxidase assembly protein [Candidatus Rokubacteria bacterium]
MTESAYWDLHPDVLAGLALLATLYLLGIGPLRRRYRWAGGVAPWRVAAFFGALGVMFIALNGPLHDLAEHSLVSAHMVQHLLLTLVVPPLLLAGSPGWLLRPVLTIRRAAAVGQVLTRPLPALSIYTVVFTTWHLPIPYEWALKDHGVHILEHLLFIATALLLWWPVLSPLPDWPRPAPPAQLLYLFVAGIPMVPVAAFLTLSDEVLYPFYGKAPWQWGLSPLADQRLGGVLMWIGGPLVFLIAMTIVFFRWASRDVEPEQAAPARGGAHGTP